MLDDAEIVELQRNCTRFVHWHGKQTAAGMLATIPPDTELDRYGSGGVVAELETTIAELLDKPAAVFVPSGTMAQQAVLRVHADQRSRRTLLFHPECHLDVHEGRGYQRLHGLVGRPVGQRSRLITRADLDEVPERAAALVLELPQRDLGGVQPAWDDLVAHTSWARERGAACHLDGARLWESAAGYGRPPAEVAALFDTVYVSFYKGLGALPGCCVAGEADVIAQLREWRGRMGGTLFAMWPNAASALTCLRQRLPKMPEYLARAVAFADAVSDVDGVAVIPSRPQTPMCHLTFETTPERFDATVRRLATEQQVWTWGRAWPGSTDRLQRVELSFGDGSGDFAPAEFREVVSAFVA